MSQKWMWCMEAVWVSSTQPCPTDKRPKPEWNLIWFGPKVLAHHTGPGYAPRPSPPPAQSHRRSPPLMPLLPSSSPPTSAAAPWRRQRLGFAPNCSDAGRPSTAPTATSSRPRRHPLPPPAILAISHGHPCLPPQPTPLASFAAPSPLPLPLASASSGRPHRYRSPA